MNRDKALELEIQLLLYKYDYRELIKAFAFTQKASPEEIEQQITSLKAIKDRSKKHTTPKKKISAIEIATKIAIEIPEISEQIKQLSLKFDNKTFLPQLKDVKRFIEKQSGKPYNSKSRDLAVKHVFAFLKKMNIGQLEELIDSSSNSQSDYSILSDQLIRKNVE